MLEGAERLAGRRSRGRSGCAGGGSGCRTRGASILRFKAGCRFKIDLGAAPENDARELRRGGVGSKYIADRHAHRAIGVYVITAD